MPQMSEEGMKKKRKIFLASTVFFVVYLFLIFKQSNILSGIFQSQLPVSIPKLSTILFTPDWINIIIQQAKRGVILVGIVVGVEIIIFLVILILFLIYFWKTRALSEWRWNDYVVFVGYSLMLLVSVICAYQVISQTWTMVSMIQQRLSILSPYELETAFNKYKTFLENYTFTLSKLGEDLATITSEFNHIFDKVGQIRNISNLIIRWGQSIDQWRFYFIIGYLVSLLSVLIGFLSQWVHLYRWLKNRKTKKDVMNERLLKILEQQQEMMEKWNKEDN